MATNSDSSGNSGGGGGGVNTTEARPSRYESQKRRDWNTFGQYLRNHRPPLALSRCSGAHVLEFLRYLDQFGKTKVHTVGCPFFGVPQPPAPCPCPLKQAWGSLDALVGRLRAAFEENGGHPDANPFGARAVRLYLREVRDTQAKARGIAYEKKKRKRPPHQQQQQQQQQQSQTHQQQQLQPAGTVLQQSSISAACIPPQWMDHHAAVMFPAFMHQNSSAGAHDHFGQQQVMHHHHGLMMALASSEVADNDDGVISVTDARAAGGLIPLPVLH